MRESESSRSRATSSSASAPSPAATGLDRLALILATAGGAGYAPVAPGTAGSLVAVAILWLVPFSGLALVVYFLAVTLVGLWAAERAETVLGAKDPGAIVIDEVAGLTVAAVGLLLVDVALTPARLAVAFGLFRLFDIVKPPPARRLQNLPGGRGVMMDDLAAGVYAFVALMVLRAVTRWP